MTEQENRIRSPFAELSFSEQQEMWRIWRSKSLDYQEIKPLKPAAAPKEEPAPPAPIQPFSPPSHKNLDSVHARISAAAAHAGTFRPLT